VSSAGQTGAELPQDLDDRSFKFFNKILDTVVDRAHNDDEFLDHTSLGKELLQEFEAQVQLAKERTASSTGIKEEAFLDIVDHSRIAENGLCGKIGHAEHSREADVVKAEIVTHVKVPTAGQHAAESNEALLKSCPDDAVQRCDALETAGAVTEASGRAGGINQLSLEDGGQRRVKLDCAANKLCEFSGASEQAEEAKTGGGELETDAAHDASAPAGAEKLVSRDKESGGNLTSHVGEDLEHTQNIQDSNDEAQEQNKRQEAVSGGEPRDEELSTQLHRTRSAGTPSSPPSQGAACDQDGSGDMFRADQQASLSGRCEDLQEISGSEVQKRCAQAPRACSASETTSNKNADGNGASSRDANECINKAALSPGALVSAEHTSRVAVLGLSEVEEPITDATFLEAEDKPQHPQAPTTLGHTNTATTDSEDEPIIPQRVARCVSNTDLADSDDEPPIPRRASAAAVVDTKTASGTASVTAKHARMQRSGPETVPGSIPAGGHSLSAKGHASFRGHSDSVADASALSAHELMKLGDEVEGSAFRRAVFWHWNNLEYGCSADLDWVRLCCTRS
jgi:hypothetical protein